MAESKEELKILLLKVGNKQASLKLDSKMKIMASGSITLWQIGKQWEQLQTLFSCVPKSLQRVTAAMNLKDAC